MASPKNNKNKNTRPVAAKASSTAIDRKLIIRLSLFLFIISFLLYVNTLHHNYVLDDAAVIKENTLTKGGIHSIPKILSSCYREGYVNNDHGIYRPLTKVMFAIEWQIAPNKPFLGHLMNVIFYSLTCVFLFMVLLRFIKINVYILFFAALLFAVHPIHTEVVANIKSRDEIMSAFFLLISLLAIHKYIMNRKILLLISSLISFFLALLSKESAIMYVAIVPLVIYYFTETSVKENLKVTALTAVTAIAYLCLHLKVMGAIGIPNIHPTDNSLLMATNFFQQKATAVYILGKYLLLLFFPHPLSSDYSFSTIPIVTSAGNAGFLLAFLIHISLLIYAIMKFKQKQFLSFCILFYLVSISIASNMFMIIGTNMAERLLFFPSIAFSLAIAYFVGKLAKLDFKTLYPKMNVLLRANKLVMLVFGVVLILFSMKTIARNKVWQNGVLLYETDLKTVPNSTHLLLFHADNLTLKDSLIGLSDEARKMRFATAQKEIDKLLNIYEMMPDAHNVAGRIWYEYKNYDLAFKEYSRAMYLNSGTASYHNNVATCYFSTGKFREAAMEFKKSTELNNQDPDVYCNLGSAYGEIGQAFLRQKVSDSALIYLHLAIDNFTIATQMKPTYKSAFQFLGLTYRSIGDTINGEKYLNIGNQLK